MDEGSHLAITPIRLATAADLDAINDIYNYYVLHSTCTYQIALETTEGRSAWFAAHDANYPITVAEGEGRVIGWGSLSPFRPRAAYRPTVEPSVYVHHDYHRRGVGRALLSDLIDRAKSLGFHSLIGGTDAEQTASLALQTSLGFVRVAHLRQAGYKFDRWLDVIYMQRML